MSDSPETKAVGTSQSKDCDVRALGFAAALKLLLCTSLPQEPSAETPARAPHQVIDHAAACGLLQVRKDFRRALDHCNAALRGSPDDEQTLSNRGSAHFALGNHEEALDDFNAALRLKPADARNYFNRALVHAARKDHARAIADYDEAIRLMPSLAIAYNNRAHELEVTGDIDRAIADYRAALRLAPTLGAVILRNLQRLGVEP